MKTLETRNVKIGKDIYKLTAVEAGISGPISIDLLSDIMPLLTSAFDGNFELLNKEIRTSINSEKLMDMLTKLINVDLLEKNNELITDWKVEFSRKPMTLFKLGIEALKFNCEDFFDFTSGWLTEMLNGINLKEVTESLLNYGIELPPHILALFPNSTQEKINQPENSTSSTVENVHSEKKPLEV